MSSNAAHLVFDNDLFEIQDRCVESGYNGMLPCNAPTVGVGLFCDPLHRFCSVKSICVRHKQPITNWDKLTEPWYGADSKG